MKSYDKEIHAVELMRSLRDALSAQMREMKPDEQKKFIEQRLRSAELRPVASR